MPHIHVLTELGIRVACLDNVVAGEGGVIWLSCHVIDCSRRVVLNCTNVWARSRLFTFLAMCIARIMDGCLSFFVHVKPGNIVRTCQFEADRLLICARHFDNTSFYSAYKKILHFCFLISRNCGSCCIDVVIFFAFTKMKFTYFWHLNPRKKFTYTLLLKLLYIWPHIIVAPCYEITVASMFNCKLL